LSPIGRISFDLASFLKIAQAARIFGQTFSTANLMHYIISTKNWFGNILGDLFKNSSGHHGRKVLF
jgi:hypothetical protein